MDWVNSICFSTFFTWFVIASSSPGKICCLYFFLPDLFSGLTLRDAGAWSSFAANEFLYWFLRLKDVTSYFPTDMRLAWAGVAELSASSFKYILLMFGETWVMPEWGLRLWGSTWNVKAGDPIETEGCFSGKDPSLAFSCPLRLEGRSYWALKLCLFLLEATGDFWLDNWVWVGKVDSKF